MTDFGEIPEFSRDLKKLYKDPIYKVRHFRCKALKGKGSRSGIRVIYAYEQDKALVTLIEVYHTMKVNREMKTGKEF